MRANIRSAVLLGAMIICPAISSTQIPPRAAKAVDVLDAVVGKNVKTFAIRSDATVVDHGVSETTDEKAESDSEGDESAHTSEASNDSHETDSSDTHASVSAHGGNSGGRSIAARAGIAAGIIVGVLSVVVVGVVLAFREANRKDRAHTFRVLEEVEKKEPVPVPQQTEYEEQQELLSAAEAGQISRAPTLPPKSQRRIVSGGSEDYDLRDGHAQRLYASESR